MIELYIESGSVSLVADEVVLDHGEYKSKLSCTPLACLLTFDLEMQHLDSEHVNLFNEAYRLDKGPRRLQILPTFVTSLYLLCHYKTMSEAPHMRINHTVLFNRIPRHLSVTCGWVNIHYDQVRRPMKNGCFRGLSDR